MNCAFDRLGDFATRLLAIVALALLTLQAIGGIDVQPLVSLAKVIWEHLGH
ncbi:MAG TPA: hypothetical protein VGF38_09835 [Ktedonobacterales bacterium]